MGPMRLYMNSCADQVLPQTALCPNLPYKKNMAEKMAATLARFTQILMIEFPYRRRSMGPMRLYQMYSIRYISLNWNSAV